MEIKVGKGRPTVWLYYQVNIADFTDDWEALCDPMCLADRETFNGQVKGA